jgi:hypothetical protein
MGIVDWFRGVFSSSGANKSEDERSAPDFVAGGPTGQGFAGLEDAAAADAAIHATDPPDDEIA